MSFWAKLFDLILLIILVPVVILKFIWSWLSGKPAYGPSKGKRKGPNEIDVEFSVEEDTPHKKQN
ncbi:MAG: hypothetical protein NUV57_02910 [archaeon]|nr:hypothetical protein [archaeon]